MADPIPHPSLREPTEAERLLALKQYRVCRETGELPVPALRRARGVLAAAVVGSLQRGSVPSAYVFVRAIEHLDSLRPVAEQWEAEDRLASSQADRSRRLAAKQAAESEAVRRAGRGTTAAFCGTCNHWRIWWCPTLLQYECDHCGGTDVVPRWVGRESDREVGAEA